MADRVVKVSLNAQVSDYVAGMSKASAATREVSTEAQKLAQKGEAIQSVGKAALAVGALAAVGVGLAVAKFAEFDKAMSSVQAATHESAANMGLLRNAALDFGASTAFTATEAASAIEELAKAGVKTADILGGGLKGSLDLAAAGELEVGTAAEIAATALTQFNLAGSDVPHVADLLAAGAGKAQGSVGDLSAALNQSGLVASQMGLSIEETTGALAAFASRGLLGSDAGTSFRQMLLRLANPTKEASDLMHELEISAYDASGQFVGMESLAGQLRAKLGGLTQAQRDQNLAVIFGSDAIRAANVLYSESASGVAEWAEKVDDSGFAAETAAIRMDNLAGDLEKLGGAFDTALIKTGSAANDALRGLVQGVTAAIDAFGEAPQVVQTATLAVGALTAGIGLAGGAALIAVPKIAAFKVALETLGVSASKTNAVMSGLKGTMIGLGAVAVGAWGASLTKQFIDGQREAAGLKDTVESLTESLSDLGAKGTVDSVVGDGLGKLTDGGFFSEILRGAEGFLDVAEDSSLALQALGTDGQLTSSKLKTLDATMAELVGSGNAEQAAALYDELASRTNGSSDAIDALNGLLPQYAEAQTGASEATSEATSEVETFASTAETAQEAVDSFTEALRGLGDTQLSLNEANRAVEESLDAFQESIAANGQTLDITTEAGRQNSAALDGIAQSYKDVAAATVEQTGAQADAIPVIAAGRQAIIDAGVAAGLSADQANAYADELGLIPEDVQTHIDLQTDAAMARAREMARMIEEIPNSKTVYLYVQEQRQVLGPGQQGQTLANGGMQVYANADGNMHSGFYSGGTPLYKFAEPEVGWEAFISGKPGMESRNRGIALEAYERLGGRLPTVGVAGGGMSLDGASITGVLEIGGDGLGRIVDGRIRMADKQANRESERRSTGF